MEDVRIVNIFMLVTEVVQHQQLMTIGETELIFALYGKLSLNIMKRYSTTLAFHCLTKQLLIVDLKEKVIKTDLTVMPLTAITAITWMERRLSLIHI